VLVLLMREIYEVCLQMASCGMIYIPSFMNTGTKVQVILRFCLNNLKRCNIGITDVWDLCMMPLRWDQVA
jgi:hypothetical protein